MKNQFRLGAAMCVLLGIAGCGVVQATKDGAVDAAKWAFTTQIKTMNIDLLARSSLNPNSGGRSLSTVVRVYQLKTAKNFEKLDYAQLQRNDIEALKPDLLATKDIVLRPDSHASISEPMNSEAEYVGVVAFFRDTNGTSQWKLVLPKKQWKKIDPVKIEVRESSLELREG
ncbi:type VI secretion system lipoprotein TssJ [Herbaspirillum sp. RV1423]|uniref:type VI secretion system lipoprotein TssJ n=1 Tax=Herbaspirillum sp. RV1423 TaxID=1443993 RepID=UPI0004B03E77|nr:type VI secretion system lipoprotein TssJ [Herbaspirillum sp. RV1423]